MSAALADYLGSDRTRSEVVTHTVTYPEATINGTLNGWCVTSPVLSLTANEPVSGYQILLIEGTRNGETFACQGAGCDMPLLEGENTLTFWALSSWGDSSTFQVSRAYEASGERFTTTLLTFPRHLLRRQEPLLHPPDCLAPPPWRQ